MMNLPSCSKDRLLTIAQVAEILNVSPRSARRRAEEGHFRCLKIGGCLRVLESSVYDYLERQIENFLWENGESLPGIDRG